MKTYLALDGGGTKTDVLLVDREGHLLHEWRKVSVKGHAQEVLATLREADRG